MTPLLVTPNRRAALALGAGSLAAALAACAKPAGSGRSSDLTLRVATYKGGVETFLKAAGQADTPYKVQFAEFAGGNLITEAIIAGAIDIGSMSEIPPIFVAASKPALRLIAVQKGDVNSQVVLVPKGSPITDPAQLKGRKVGYVRATTSQYLLIRLLEEHGLTFADITPVALSPQDGRAAFEHGSLDAWVAYGVQATAVRGTVGARVLATGLGRLSGNYLFAASQSALKDPPRRAAIVDYLKRVRRTYQWTDAHPDDWARLAAAATGVPAALYAQQRRERSAATRLAPVDASAVASQQAVADGFTKAGVLSGHVDVTPLWDPALNSDLGPATP
ncbi:MAG TPA: ABC transporter substrate-binding protein [Caulobacteraceae bacterium]